MLARYNRIANARLYEQCGKLDLVEYRRERRGSFGSIHALLNHMLLGDRIWMSRFAGGGNTTPPLNTILFESFAELHAARSQEDASIKLLRKNRPRLSPQAPALTQIAERRIAWMQRQWPSAFL